MSINGILPFKSAIGNNIRWHNGYYFLDGKASQVSELCPDMKEWLKIKAYTVILSGEERFYTNIPTKDRDAETKELIKLLNDKKFKKWVDDNPIITKEKQK